MSSFSLTPTPRPAGPLAQVTIAPELLSATAVTRRPPCPSWETGGACGRGKAVQATVEHREPCDSRGSCTVLGAPGGEIPPGDSTGCPDGGELATGRYRLTSPVPVGPDEGLLIEPTPAGQPCRRNGSLCPHSSHWPMAPGSGQEGGQRTFGFTGFGSWSCKNRLT